MIMVTAAYIRVLCSRMAEHEWNSYTDNGISVLMALAVVISSRREGNVVMLYWSALWPIRLWPAFADSSQFAYQELSYCQLATWSGTLRKMLMSTFVSFYSGVSLWIMRLLDLPLVLEYYYTEVLCEKAIYKKSRRLQYKLKNRLLQSVESRVAASWNTCPTCRHMYTHIHVVENAYWMLEPLSVHIERLT